MLCHTEDLDCLQDLREEIVPVSESVMQECAVSNPFWDFEPKRQKHCCCSDPRMLSGVCGCFFCAPVCGGKLLAGQGTLKISGNGTQACSCRPFLPYVFWKCL